MDAMRFIKSFSKGQITIPKELREKLGVSEEFWMKIFIDNGKIVVEPVNTVEPKKSKEEYLNDLLSMDTSWFSEEDDQDYKRVRQEADEHVEKNSL